MATLEEIAKLAKVSRSTVSRVINHESRVSDVTRERVWSVIREADYHPNIAARALAGRHSHIIGLVMVRPYNVVTSDPFSSALIQVIVEACESDGYHLMLSLASTNDPDTYGRIVRSGYQDGLIVYYACMDDSFTQQLVREQVPFVLIGHPPHEINMFSADVANAQGAEHMAWHLAELGYTRIAMITGPSFAMSSLDRRNGFLKGLLAKGLKCPPQYTREGDFSEASGFEAMQQLLAQNPRPQAVFASNDGMAFGAIRAARTARLHVPEDIAIAGFDDTPFAAVSDPPLTTVHQSPERLGTTAVTLLMHQLEPTSAHADGQRNIVLPVELIVRESCGERLGNHHSLDSSEPMFRR